MRRLAPFLIAVATLALMASACSRRDRANPLDPSNPQTGGRPENFNALAGYSTVSLVWRPRPDLAIDGFQVYRLSPGDSVYRALASVQPAPSAGFLDASVRNGSEYRYRLHYVIDGVLSRTPAEDIATPGPLRPWVCDPGDGALVRLSADARDVVSRSHLGISPYAIAIDPLEGTLALRLTAMLTG